MLDLKSTTWRKSCFIVSKLATAADLPCWFNTAALSEFVMGASTLEAQGGGIADNSACVMYVDAIVRIEIEVK